LVDLGGELSGDFAQGFSVGGLEQEAVPVATAKAL
jgi:hypothetical protein